jgi:lipopolysaccharide export system protein LptA
VVTVEAVWQPIKRIARVTLAAAVAFCPAAISSGQEGVGGTPPEPAPVRVSADAAEYFNATGLVVFTGKVVAVQGDSTLTADRMEVALSRQEQQERTSAGPAGPADGQRIAAITATGNVSFRQVDPETKKERYATGEKAVYDDARRTVTMTGSPRLWEGKNVIVGEEMVFLLEDKRVLVKGKVNLTVFPDQLKETPRAR